MDDCKGMIKEIACMKKFFDYKIHLFSFAYVLVGVIFLQNISDIFFLKNEVIYLASPYYNFVGIAKSLVFLSSYLAVVLLIWVSLFSKSRVVWFFVAFILFIFNFLDIFIQLAVNNRGFTKYEYSITLAEYNSYKNMAFFMMDGVRSCGISLLFVLGLVFIRRNIETKQISTKWFCLCMILVFSIVFGAKQWVYYIKYPSYSALVKVPLIIFDYHLNSKDEIPRVLNKSIIPNKEGDNENIIWMIDESIGGKYLSINGFEKNTTPYLESLIGSRNMVNYGVVNSVANCSATSNLMMRIGLSSHTKGAEQDHIQTRNKLPTIYQYAKRAGYTTWLFDSQADQGQVQNYLTPYDMQSIDHFITLDTRTNDIERDSLHLNKISRVLKDKVGGKNFIVFVKDGAHWPYLWRYPKDKEIFTPVQESIYEEKTLEKKANLINTYSNVIRYAVDDFFRKYMDKIDISKTILFYTSDHGQNLLEEPRSPLTHCSSLKDSPKSEAEVPLLIFGKNVGKRFIVKENKLYSQYQIFPTILSLMGYNSEIIEEYGATLMEGQGRNEKQWFYQGLEGNRVLFR